MTIYRFLLCMFLMFTGGQVFAQYMLDGNIYTGSELIRTGIQSYDEGEYEEALELFNMINPGDSSYTRARYEAMLTYNALEDYETAVMIGMEEIHKESDEPNIYQLTGSCLDELERYDEAREIFEIGIKRYPENAMIRLNYATSFEMTDEYEKALEIYQDLLRRNPMFASGHRRLGDLCTREGRITQAMICYTTALVFELDASVSFPLVVRMDELAQMAYDEYGTSDQTSVEPEYERVDRLLESQVAQNRQYKSGAKTVFPITEAIHLTINEVAKLPKSNGFWGDYYHDFVELMAAEKYKLLSLLTINSSGLESIQKQVNKNTNKLVELRTRLANEFISMHEVYPVEVNGEMIDMTTRFDGQSDYVIARGELDRDGTMNGYWQYFYRDGALLSESQFIDGKPDGDLIFYRKYHDTLRIQHFEDQELNGEWKEFYPNGVISISSMYRDGKKHGPEKEYYPNGSLQSEVEAVDGTYDGEVTEYFAFGQIEYIYARDMGVFQGKFEEFYADSSLYLEFDVTDNYINGKRLQYAYNGQLVDQQVYIDGKSNGPFTTYYSTGEKRSEGRAADDEYEGVIDNFDVFGKLISKESYSGGEQDGVSQYFRGDGSLYCKQEHKEGALQTLVFFDENEEVINRYNTGRRQVEVSILDENGEVISQGLFENGKRTGTWEFFEDGVLSSIGNYRDGELEGEYIEYHSNGMVASRHSNSEGSAEDPGSKYYVHGVLADSGLYRGGDKQGEWRSYYPDGSLSSVGWYEDGKVYGFNESYWPNGNIKEEWLYEEDRLNGLISYDTLGSPIDTSKLSHGDGLLTGYYSNGKPSLEYEIINGGTHGRSATYYPNEQIQLKVNQLSNSNHGALTFYNPMGEIESTAENVLGRRSGERITYYPSRKVEETATHLDNVVHGPTTEYHSNGQEFRTRNFVLGRPHGENTWYAPTGEIMYIKHYYEGVFVGYQYEKSPGVLSDTIWMENESGKVVCYYANSQVSLESEYKFGSNVGEIKAYHPDGSLMYSKKCDGYGLWQGVSEDYYPNGNIRMRKNYKDGVEHGLIEFFYENGQPYIKRTEYYGYTHGEKIYYDMQGYKVITLYFVMNEIVGYENH